MEASAEFVERTTCIQCGSPRLLELSSGLFSEGAVARFIDEDPWGEHPAPFLRGKRWSYVRCAQCAQAFHRFILAPEWNERRFSRWMTQEAIEAFENSMNTPERRFETTVANAAHVVRIEEMTREVRLGAGVRLLDFGCGYGHFLSMCALFGFDATGVDRSAAKREHGTFPIFASLDEVSGPFHAVTLFEVLEHVDEPRPLLQRLASLLVPGGVLVLETPNCEGITGIETREDYLKIHPLEHINGFTPATLQAFAERVGFLRVDRPAAYVTTSLARVARNVAKRVILRDQTQQYFIKK